MVFLLRRGILYSWKLKLKRRRGPVWAPVHFQAQLCDKSPVFQIHPYKLRLRDCLLETLSSSWIPKAWVLLNGTQWLWEPSQHPLSSMITTARTCAAFYFLKHVLYPQIHRYLRKSEKTTRLDVVLITAFLVGNALCVAIGVKDSPSLIVRTGLMSTVNFIPLALGDHMNIVVSRCGITSRAYERMHR